METKEDIMASEGDAFGSLGVVGEEMRLLEDRKRMELREELRRIDDMGVVAARSKVLDRRLGRNLVCKLKTGPLGRRRNHHHWHRRRYISGKKHRSEKRRSSGNIQADSDSRLSPLKLQQQQELAELKEMSLVKNSRDNISKLRNHIHDHISRMTNHRLMIKPHDGGKENHKKSSVLVTSMEDQEEQARQLYRQQSRVIIESLLQVPSHKVRVLQRLNSEQVQNISDTELAKISQGEKELEHHSVMENLPVLESIAEVPPSPIIAPPTPNKTHGQADIATSPQAFIGNSMAPVVPKHEDVPSKDVRKSHAIVCDGEDEELSSDDDICRDRPCYKDDNMNELKEVGERIEGEQKLMKDMLSKCIMSEDHAFLTLDKQAVLVENTGIQTRCITEGYAVTSTQRTIIDDPEVLKRSESDENEILNRLSSDEMSHSVYYASLSNGVSKSAAFTRLSSNSRDDERKFSSNSSSFDLESDEVSKSSSLKVHHSSLDDQSSPLSYHHRQFSSPHLSLSLTSEDLNSYVISAPLGSHFTPHGTYSTLEVDVDPFAKEFRCGPKIEEDYSLSRSYVPTSPGHSCSRSSPNLIQHPSDIQCFPHPAVPGIPLTAFQDPKFCKYAETLDHTLVLSDYITYKMRVIGDRIEEKYADKLDQAVEEVFYELVKENLTWNSFSSVAKRLLWEGARIQDGIMLIPCFARQLVDCVPHLGETIGHYTETILDNYAAESILGMGGWNSLMESYEDIEGYSENEIMNESTLSPSVYNTLPHKRRRFEELKDVATMTTSYEHSLQLKRCISVEVLFTETVEEESEKKVNFQPSLKCFSFSRSISTDSLDLATPKTPNLSRKQFTTDSALTPDMTPKSERRFLPMVDEESRLSSRRGSASSVIIIPGPSPQDESTDGFEIIGRSVSELHQAHSLSSESLLSGENGHKVDHVSIELTLSNEYLPNLYSEHSKTKETQLNHALSSSSNEDDSGPTRPTDHGRRRRSSVAEVVLPVSALAVHVVFMGFIYLAK